MGSFIGGPIHTIILVGGLYIPLQLCRKYGIRSGLKNVDWVILTGVVTDGGDPKNHYMSEKLGQLVSGRE